MRQAIRIAHDFTCPWCWIGLHQARRLEEEFGVEIDFVPYETYPEDVPLPDATSAPGVLEAPPTPSRLELAFHCEGIPFRNRPEVRSHDALEAVEFARTEGKAREMVDALYHAYWVDGANLDVETLVAVAEGIVADCDGLRAAVQERRFAGAITAFDEGAYRSDVFHVPTFFIGEGRHAEQPYPVLREALVRELGEPKPYQGLRLPAPPEDRPYVVVNMVATVDGKTVLTDRNSPVHGLGSALDREVMRVLHQKVDAVLIGAGTLRATPGIWYEQRLRRYVATQGGELPVNRFFTDAPERAWVIAPEGVELAVPPGVAHVSLAAGWPGALRALRQAGVFHLLVEGGSELNGELFGQDLVDELFLTIAPKIKLGRDLPTVAGGQPLDGRLHQMELVSETRAGDELYLRYRRKRSR